MPEFADGSFMINDDGDVIHQWIYETPSFRFCSVCGLTQHYAYTLYEWVDLETENVILSK